MESKESPLVRWRTLAYAVWAVIGIVAILYASALVLGRLSGALVPFFIAFLFVFFLQGPVNALVRRGLGRSVAVGLCFLGAVVAIAVAGVFLIPPLVRQIIEFADSTPGYLHQGEILLGELQAQYSEAVIPAWLRSSATSIASALSQGFVRIGNTLAQGLLSAGGGIATVVFDLFLGAVIAFWTLKDLPSIRREMRTLVSERYEEDLENLIDTTTRVVGGYLKGQTLVSLVTGTLAWIGLAIVGVPYALVLGIITYVTNYVPYVGPVISAAIAAGVALFISPVKAVIAIAIIIGAQQVTDLFVSPRVMSEQVDLHPTLVVFSLLVGGSLFGFWGMILAIPVAATAKGLFVYYYERKTKRPLATENGALFRASACDEDAEGCEPSDEVQDPEATGDADSDTERGAST